MILHNVFFGLNIFLLFIIAMELFLWKISGLSKMENQSFSYAEVDEDVQTIKNYHKSILPEVEYGRQQDIVQHLTRPRIAFHQFCFILKLCEQMRHFSPMLMYTSRYLVENK